MYTIPPYTKIKNEFKAKGDPDIIYFQYKKFCSYKLEHIIVDLVPTKRLVAFFSRSYILSRTAIYHMYICLLKWETLSLGKFNKVIIIMKKLALRWQWVHIMWGWRILSSSFTCFYYDRVVMDSLLTLVSTYIDG